MLLPLARELNYGNYIIRTATPAAGMIPTFEREVRAREPDAVFMDRGTFRELADVKLFPVRAGAWLTPVSGEPAQRPESSGSRLMPK